MFKKDNCVTKRDLNKALKKTEVKIDKKFDLQEKYFDEKLTVQEKRSDMKLERSLANQADMILGAVGLMFKKNDARLDGICKQLADLKDESKCASELLRRHDKKIENHEKRIYSLEIA